MKLSKVGVFIKTSTKVYEDFVHVLLEFNLTNKIGIKLPKCPAVVSFRGPPS